MLVFKQSNIRSSIFFSLYSVDGIIYVLPLIYCNPSFVDVLHPPPHRVLDAMEGFVFCDELSKMFLACYGMGLLILSPDRATCFITSLLVETLYLFHIHIACHSRHIVVESSVEIRVLMHTKSLLFLVLRAVGRPQHVGPFISLHSMRPKTSTIPQIEANIPSMLLVAQLSFSQSVYYFVK